MDPRRMDAHDSTATSPTPLSEGGPILVIGGTRGTGLLIAHLLTQQGAAVRVLARNPARAATPTAAPAAASERSVL